MKKHSKLKIFFTIVILIAIVIGGFLLIRKYYPSYYASITGDRTVVQEDERAKDQYPLKYFYSGNLTQTFHLNKGTAVFYLEYEGGSDFLATVLTNEGRLIGTLAQEKGNFAGRREINVPETDAYLLDVKTSGKWNIAYK